MAVAASGPRPPAARINILGVPVDGVTRAEAVARALGLAASGAVHQIVTANPLLVLESAAHPELAAACRAASLSIADASGLTWAARRLGTPLPERIPGVDFAYDLCAASARAGESVFLLGAAPDVVERAADHLRQAHPALRIAGLRNGYFTAADEPAVLDELRRSRARVFLVALGMPRQDLWIHRNKARLPHGVYVGLGGTFDVWSGRVRRAPAWVQAAGVEWAYRWLHEPWRWRRMARLPLFAWRIVRSSSAVSKPRS